MDGLPQVKGDYGSTLTAVTVGCSHVSLSMVDNFFLFLLVCETLVIHTRKQEMISMYDRIFSGMVV